MKSKCYFWYLDLISLKLKECVQQVYPLKVLCSLSILLIVVNFCQHFSSSKPFNQLMYKKRRKIGECEEKKRWQIRWRREPLATTCELPRVITHCPIYNPLLTICPLYNLLSGDVAPKSVPAI